MSKHTTRSDATRIFQIHDGNVDQILFCDESDTEDALVLDEEDIGFLQEDVEHLEAKNNPNETMEVVIESSEAQISAQTSNDNSSQTYIQKRTPEEKKIQWRCVSNEDQQTLYRSVPRKPILI